MYSLDQLLSLPDELAAEGERMLAIPLDGDALTEARDHLASTRRILEGLVDKASEEEQELAQMALEQLEVVESILAERERELTVERALAEIADLNIDIVKRYLDAGERELRIAVARQAAEVEFEATIPLLKTRLTQESDLHVVASLVKSIGLLGRDEELALLGEYLAHEDYRVRANAIEGLSRVQSSTKLTLCSAMLGDEHHRVALNAALQLRADDPTVLEDIVSQLWEHGTLEARQAVLWAATTHLEAESGRTWLLRGLEDRGHPALALDALDCFPSCDDHEIVERILSYLDELQPGELGYRAMRERIFSLQASTNSAVQGLVRAAVDELLARERGCADECSTDELVEQVRAAAPSSNDETGQSPDVVAGTLPPGQRKLRPPKTQAAQQKQQRTIWVRLAGRVVAGVRKDAVKQVTIRLSNTGFQEMSDRHGRFCFERIEANKVHVFVCEKRGWPTTTFRYRATGQRDQRVIIRMRPRGSAHQTRKR